MDTAQAAVGSVRSAEAQEERSQTVVRGQDLARRAVDVVIEELNRRVRLHQLDRGLRLNLPYYNDWRLGLRWWDFTEIPRERILFVPAFVVLAAEREMERVRRERESTPSTRTHLLELLGRLRRAFAETVVA